MKLIEVTCYEKAKQFDFLVNCCQSDISLRWIKYKYISFVLYEVENIRLKNLKGAFASVWFNIATSDRLSSASVEIDKYYSLILP